MGSLSLRPDYGVDSNPSLPRGYESNSERVSHTSNRRGHTMNLAQKIAMQHLGAIGFAPMGDTRGWKPTGDGTRVGLFIPLPETLANQFPSKEEDISPPHVTFLIVGSVPKNREQEFVDVVNTVLTKEPSPVRARVSGIDRFVHATEEHQETIFFSQVTFSRDMAEVRDRVWMALESAGFVVGDQHPYAYTPHVTLAYVPGANRPSYQGPVPHGTWNFNGIHIWGLSKPYVVEMGSFYGKNIVPFPVVPARYASLDMNIFTNKYVQGIQEYARQLSLHESTIEDLFRIADPKRMGRIGDVKVSLTSASAEKVEGRVSGRTGNYDTRISIQPKRGFHCTCPDFVQRGMRDGPCKHVLATALEWKERVLQAEDRLQAQLDVILEREFASKQASRIADRYLQAAVPAKYDHIDFTPPQSVADAASKGLEYRAKASPSNKGGLTT